MKPEAGFYMDRAQECLTRAKIILGAGVIEDAGRNAYLAAFHAAQALIFERMGKVAKTHHGVHTLISGFAKEQAQLHEFASFLSRAYDLKDIADYRVGPDAVVVSESDARDAIAAAQAFVAQIGALLS